jgi:uncharacterized protein
MEMMEQLILLAELNELEINLRKITDRLLVLPEAAEVAQKEASGLGKKLDSMAAQRVEANRKLRTLEIDLASEKDHLRKWQKRLDQIREEREHAALSSEIGSQKRAIGKKENEILDAMEVLEQMDTEIATVQMKHDVAVELSNAEMEKVSEEIASERAKQGEGQQARGVLLEKLPSGLVKRYQRIAERRQGQGVAILQGETCTACFHTVIPQLANEVLQGKVIETCNSCQRILVHESATKSAAVDDAVAEATAS